MSDHEQRRTGMGVSSERVGHTGPGQVGTHGVRDTSPPQRPEDADVPPEQRPEDADVPPEQRPGAVEENPVGLEPVPEHPSLDPRSSDAP